MKYTDETFSKMSKAILILQKLLLYRDLQNTLEIDPDFGCCSGQTTNLYSIDLI